jgi:hypothetical protein
LETNLIKGVYSFVVIVLQAPYVADQKKQMLNRIYKMMDDKEDSFGFSGTDFLPCLPSLASNDTTINMVKISSRNEPKSKRFRSICLSKPHLRQTYLFLFMRVLGKRTMIAFAILRTVFLEHNLTP